MIKKFFDNFSEVFSVGEPTESELNSIGASLVVLANSLNLDRKKFREAINGEELVYPLHVTGNGPSLYLVSDAAGVQGAPHEHQTWAVIAGISGNEVNVFFEISDFETKSVKPVSKIEVRSGDVICMDCASIHSTYASGLHATFHLHLYGKPLHKLPPYQTRCYVAKIES